MRTKICLDQPKTFNDSLTKIPIKILNNTKNFLILPNKIKTFIMKNLMFKLDQTNLTLLPTIQYYPIMRSIKIVWLNFNLIYFIR